MKYQREVQVLNSHFYKPKALFEVEVFVFRGKAPVIRLAQPKGLGTQLNTKRKGQRPGSFNSRQTRLVKTAGLSALNEHSTQHPALQAGLGKLLGRWPETT